MKIDIEKDLKISENWLNAGMKSIVEYKKLN